VFFSRTQITEQVTVTREQEREVGEAVEKVGQITLLDFHYRLRRN